MDNKIKRRVFMGGVIGALAAGPFVIRGFFQRETAVPPHRFSRELKKYESLLQVPIRTASGPSEFELPLALPVGQAWDYVIYSPSFLPQGLSRATNHEPDTFVVREGQLTANQTKRGQVLLTGGDTHSMVCSPLATDDRPKSEVVLLLKNGHLMPAKPKGESRSAASDRQFGHLLSLEDRPENSLAVGMKWRSENSGRVKPFEGYATDYEVVGFAEVAGRKTVQVRFRADIPNIINLPGVNVDPPAKGETMSNRHHGDAWFDLETGLLVRQETEMESHSKGIPGLAAKDQPLIVKAKLIVQLFHA